MIKHHFNKFCEEYEMKMEKQLYCCCWEYALTITSLQHKKSSTASSPTGVLFNELFLFLSLIKCSFFIKHLHIDCSHGLRGSKEEDDTCH